MKFKNTLICISTILCVACFSTAKESSSSLRKENLARQGQESGNETIEPNGKPTSTSLVYCEEELNFDGFEKKYLNSNDYRSFMESVRSKAIYFYMERMILTEQTTVCITKLKVEEVISDLPKIEKPRSAGWKTHGNGQSHLLVISQKYFVEKLNFIEKAAVIIKELLHDKYSTELDSSWDRKKNQIVKMFYDSYTKGSPSTEDILKKLIDYSMFGQVELSLLVTQCREKSPDCEQLISEYKSYYEANVYLGALKIQMYFTEHIEDRKNIFFYASCKVSYEMCIEDYNRLNELWAYFEKDGSDVYIGDEYTIFLELALDSKEDRAKEGFYELFNRYSSTKHKNIELTFDYVKRAEQDYRVKDYFFVGRRDLVIYVRADLGLKNMFELYEELVRFRVFDYMEIKIFSYPVEQFIDLPLKKKKEIVSTQSAWLINERLVSYESDNFPKSLSEIRQRKGFQHVLFLAYLVEKGLLKSDIRINSRYTIKGVFKRYEETQAAYRIL